MTPIQFVQEECANHQHDGSCLGVMINADLSLSGCGPLPRCRVADGERCRYCDECVAPMVNTVTEPRRAAEIQDAVAEYRRATKQGDSSTRKCPDCGGPCQPRKRFCPKCALKRRRATFRTATGTRRQKSGMACQQLSPKTDQICQ